MRLYVRLSFLPITFAAQTWLLAQPVAIPEYKAAYEATFGIGEESRVVGQIDVTVTHEQPGDTYEVTLETRSGASENEMVVRTRARVEAGRLLPLELRAEERSRRRVVPASLLFDWEQQSLTLTYKRRSRQRQIRDIEDRELRDIAEEVAGSTTLMLPGRLSLARLDPMFVITELGSEKIETPYGTFVTRQVEFEGPSPEASTVLWLAEDLGDLPVKMERHDGARVDALLLLHLEGIASPAGGADAN